MASRTRKGKHIPQRMCVICRQRFDKRRLTRIVNTPEDGVVVDPTGKRNGRGAYLCDQLACWEKALSQARLLDQALKTDVTPQDLQRIAECKPTVSQVME
ncbi:MAG: RNase P modulator RnpM [Candidatus Promineifilaceae bacterium]|jgi:uncharacterized protein